MSGRILVLLALVFGAYFSAAGQDPTSANARERQRAARQLGEQGSAAIPALSQLLRDSEYEVRLEAVKSVVKIGTQHSLSPLVEATRDADPEIQIRATDGLVDFYVPGYVRTGLSGSLRRVGRSIRARFTDVNDLVIPPYMEVRPEVIDALGKLARGGSDMTSRANAARAVGVLRGHAAVPDLLEAVRSKDSRLMYEALIALKKIRDKSAGPEIVFLLRDLDDDVQIAAIEVTGLLQNRDALPRLREVVTDARNNKVRRAALTAIAMLPDETSRSTYQQYIQDKDADLRAAAAEGYARLRNPDDLAMVEGYFNAEKKMNPRLSLAFALVMLGRTEMSEFSPLQYLVNTLNSSMFTGVAEAFLIETSREAAVRTNLYPTLSSGTRNERIRLAHILARSGDRETEAHLERMANDPDPELSKEAVGALRTLRTRL